MIIKENSIEGVHRLKAVLKNGGVSVLPAYTVYGFSASLFDFYANYRIFDIKKRLINSPFLVIAQKEYIFDVAVDVDIERLRFLLENNITVIIKTSVNIPEYASKNSRTAFRAANTELLKRITFSFPITSTSINISGKKSLNNIQTIVDRFGHFVDIIVNGKIKNEASTIVELKGEKIKIFRKGCCIEKLKESGLC
jgi:L-threonylcarbamoyladenylate synthase